MKKERYTIGQFSAATGISKDTLRFYDKQGILTPNVVDTVSKYRYYTFEQFWYADMVVALGRLGVPLQTIKEAFALKDDNVIISLLAEKKGEALRLSEYFMRMADDIEWMERNQELEVLPDQEEEIRVEYFTERKVMFRRNLGLGADVPEPEDCYDAQVQTDSIRRTNGRIMDMEDFLSNRFTVFGTYLDMGMGGIEQVKPEHLTYLPAGEYACYITMENEYGEIDFEPLLDWLKENDKTPTMILVDRLPLGFFGEEEDEDEEDEEDTDELTDTDESEETEELTKSGETEPLSEDAFSGEGPGMSGDLSEETEDPTENFSDVVAGYQALVGGVHVIEDFELTEELNADQGVDLVGEMNASRTPAKPLVKKRYKVEVKALIR